MHHLELEVDFKSTPHLQKQSGFPKKTSWDPPQGEELTETPADSAPPLIPPHKLCPFSPSRRAPAAQEQARGLEVKPCSFGLFIFLEPLSVLGLTYHSEKA